MDLVMDLQPFDARPSPAPSPQRWFRKHSAKDWSLAPPLDFGATQPMEYGELPHIGDPVAEALQFREELRGLQVRELNSQTLFNHFFGTEPD